MGVDRVEGKGTDGRHDDAPRLRLFTASERLTYRKPQSLWVRITVKVVLH